MLNETRRPRAGRTYDVLTDDDLADIHVEYPRDVNDIDLRRVLGDDRATLIHAGRAHGWNDPDVQAALGELLHPTEVRVIRSAHPDASQVTTVDIDAGNPAERRTGKGLLDVTWSGFLSGAWTFLAWTVLATVVGFISAYLLNRAGVTKATFPGDAAWACATVLGIGGTFLLKIAGWGASVAVSARALFLAVTRPLARLKTFAILATIGAAGLVWSNIGAPAVLVRLIALMRGWQP